MKYSQFNQHVHLISHFRQRVLSLVMILFFLLLIIIGRLISLQIIDQDKYKTLSQHNLLNTIPLPPNRGLIYDRNGVLLARNVATYSLNIIPAKTPHLQTLIKQIAALIPLSDQDIQHFLRILPQHHRYDSIPIKLHLTEQQVDTIYVNRYRLPGANINANLSRQYSVNQAMTPVLGYVGRINNQELQQVDHDNYLDTNYIGKNGVEKYDESLLHGTVGVATVEINANGEIVRYLHRTPPIPGEDLHLTIDSALQQYIYQQMGNNNGAAVAINPKTGAILAMVSKPSFDPNLFSQGISQKQYNQLLNASAHPLYNRATHGLFSPGSTIKPFYALAALKKHIINDGTTIFDRGWYRLPNTKHIYHDWKYNGHGWVNVSKAIIVSCDTFFYELAVKMGIHFMDQSLKQFGFGQPTYTDINNEAAGIVPSPAWKMKQQQKSWYTGDTIITGIGQGSLLVTPLQLATATAILANRGTRVQPHLLAAINEPGLPPQPIKYNKTLVFKAPQSIWNTVITAMQGVISSPIGTAINFGPHQFSVAGKTGTAQVFGKNRDEEYDRTNIPKKLRNNHLFIAFAPVKHPKIAIAVIIEHAGTTDKLTRRILQYYLHQHSPIAAHQEKHYG